MSKLPFAIALLLLAASGIRAAGDTLELAGVALYVSGISAEPQVPAGE